MGNEMEKSNSIHQSTECDTDSVAAVGPGPLMTLPTEDDSSPTGSPNSPHKRQESCDFDSTAAVGPCLTTDSPTHATINSSPTTANATKSTVGHDSEFALPSFLQTRSNSSSTMPTFMPSATNSSTWTYKSSKSTNALLASDSSDLNDSSDMHSPKSTSSSPRRPRRPSSVTGNGYVNNSSAKSVQEPEPLQPVEVGHELEIEEGTPAANALKANAQVKVTKVGKAARYMNAQSIKRLINQTRLWKRKTGNKRGKPPRVPQIERRWSDNDIQIDTVKEGLRQIVELEDEEEEEDTSVSLRRHALDSAELSTRDFRPIPKTGTEEEPDASYVAFAGDKFDPPTITLHDKDGKKQEIKMFGKIRSAKKKEKKESRNYVKGKVIEEEHELYTLSIAVMLGLRYAIYQTHRQLENDKKENRFWLDSEEFMRMEKYVFRPDGRQNTPPHKLSHTFKFKDYSPVPFAYIRRMFGINEYEFIHSVCGNANFIEFISNAKSGQFFFYSSDGKYMIKTMTNTESKFLRRILPHYFRHCAQNPSTLMTKFLGMYRVKLYHLKRNVKFVVMNSVFDTDKMISSFYDLKGSRIGRAAKAGESVKKDNDVRSMIKRDPNNAFVLPSSVRTRLREQIVKDCNFLKEMKIMDYSMLIGVHYIPSKSARSSDSIRGLVFRDSESVRSGRSKIMQKPSFKSHERSKSDAGPGSPYKSGKVPPKLSEMQFDSKKSAGSGNAEFLLDNEVLRNELLEEKPHSPFHLNLGDADDKVTPGDNSVLSASTLGFEEEDDIYAQIEAQIEANKRALVIPSDDVMSSPLSNTSSNLDWQRERAELDLRREIATEQSYWPFHRYYEINGQRRVLPINEKYRTAARQRSTAMIPSDAVKCTSCLGDPKNFDPDLVASREKWQLQNFEKPISNRKDGGLTMDVTGIEQPMTVTAGNQKQKCDGKIFYIGIIDILQQFNVRKRMEARYRRIKGDGWDGASCVHPDFYADRFIQFYDEYTKRQNSSNSLGEPAISEEEEILFLGRTDDVPN